MSAALAVTAVVLLVGSSACNSTPDLNPSLGAYQDERSCFPFKSNLHQIYRNFESDPYFGGEAKCLRTGPTGPLVDSPLNTTFEYGSDGKINFLTTITSSPGYTAGNVVHLQPLDGAGCSFWVTDEALGDEGTCCEFVYELLCGTSPKYQIYNESCQ
ncbi:uncharacterized protein LOC144119046 isoform X2 [Amblyomma americanum]